MNRSRSLVPIPIALALAVGLAFGLGRCEPTPAARGPDGPGSHPFTTLEHRIQRGERETPLVAYLPESATPAPLVIFTPGLALESFRYLPLVERIASHGFVVIRADPPASLANVDQPEMAADVQAVVDWALDPAGPLAGKVDAARIATMGHSLGGKVATLVAAVDPRVTALFALDPVATCTGPGGGCSATNPDILPALVATLAIPVGFAGETTDATGGIGGQACAPEDGNYLRFYEAASDATALAPWAAAWTFTGANHVDFVYDHEDCLPCLFCQAGTADRTAVQDGAATLATAFLRLHLTGDSGMIPWLLGDRLPRGVQVDSERR